MARIAPRIEQTDPLRAWDPRLIPLLDAAPRAGLVEMVCDLLLETGHPAGPPLRRGLRDPRITSTGLLRVAIPGIFHPRTRTYACGELRPPSAPSLCMPVIMLPPIDGPPPSGARRTGWTADDTLPGPVWVSAETIDAETWRQGVGDQIPFEASASQRALGWCLNLALDRPRPEELAQLAPAAEAFARVRSDRPRLAGTGSGWRACARQDDAPELALLLRAGTARQRFAAAHAIAMRRQRSERPEGPTSDELAALRGALAADWQLAQLAHHALVAAGQPAALETALEGDIQSGRLELPLLALIDGALPARLEPPLYQAWRTAPPPHDTLRQLLAGCQAANLVARYQRLPPSAQRAAIEELLRSAASWRLANILRGPDSPLRAALFLELGRSEEGTAGAAGLAAFELAAAADPRAALIERWPTQQQGDAAREAIERAFEAVLETAPIAEVLSLADATWQHHGWPRAMTRAVAALLSHADDALACRAARLLVSERGLTCEALVRALPELLERADPQTIAALLSASDDVPDALSDFLVALAGEDEATSLAIVRGALEHLRLSGYAVARAEQRLAREAQCGQEDEDEARLDELRQRLGEEVLRYQRDPALRLLAVETIPPGRGDLELLRHSWREDDVETRCALLRRHADRLLQPHEVSAVLAEFTSYPELQLHLLARFPPPLEQREHVLRLSQRNGGRPLLASFLDTHYPAPGLEPLVSRWLEIAAEPAMQGEVAQTVNRCPRLAPLLIPSVDAERGSGLIGIIRRALPHIPEPERLEALTALAARAEELPPYLRGELLELLQLCEPPPQPLTAREAQAALDHADAGLRSRAARALISTPLLLRAIDPVTCSMERRCKLIRALAQAPSTPWRRAAMIALERGEPLPDQAL